ncbi:MAG: hypothetical protein ACYTBS_20790 [Planctomycetota bacterium]
MRRNGKDPICGFVVAAATLLFLTGAVWAIPSHISITVPSSTNFELEVALYDNSPVIGDSWALIDNVVFGIAIDDFEGGTAGGFDVSLNPGSVSTAPGNLNGTGSYVLRIDEDPVVYPTFTFQDYVGASVTTLEFDVEFFGDAGGCDELVFSVLDWSLNPLLTGLTPTFGDVLAVYSGGMEYTNNVSVAPTTIIPVPGALLLVMIGVGTAGIFRRVTC